LIFEMTDELKLVKETAGRMADEIFKPLAERWDQNEEPPMQNLRVLAENDMAGITIPEDYGGSGASIIHAMLAIEEISRACPLTAGFILASAVTSEMMVSFGTEEHRQRWLPGLAAGNHVVAWAMTEPDAGSAANELRATAVREGDEWVLGGNKIFITRGAVADGFIFFARVDDVPGSAGIAAFLVEKGTPGFEVGAIDRHMGFRGAASCELVVDGCRVGEETMLIQPGSFAQVMKGLNVARVLNPTLCLGIAQEALNLTRQYVTERRQFGRQLGAFQGLQWMLADMAIKVDAMRLLIYRAATTTFEDLDSAPLDAAVAKTYANEAAFQVADAALQLHGGYGYSQEFPIERMFRDVRAFQIAGGSTQILRNRIAQLMLQGKLDRPKMKVTA